MNVEPVISIPLLLHLTAVSQRKVHSALTASLNRGLKVASWHITRYLKV